MKIVFGGMTIFLLMLAPILGWCCTSFVAGKKATVDGSVIAAHNEDLRADTAQRVEVFPVKNSSQGNWSFWVAGKPFRMLQRNLR